MLQGDRKLQTIDCDLPILRSVSGERRRPIARLGHFEFIRLSFPGHPNSLLRQYDAVSQLRCFFLTQDTEPDKGVSACGIV